MGKTKQFTIMAPFEVKAVTTPPNDPDTTGSGESEVIKVSGYANFSGKVEDGDVFIDLVGDVVVPSGIDVTTWKKNPQLLLQHDRHTTVGRGASVVKKKDGLFIEAEVHAGAMSPEDFYRVKAGLLCYFSIGFRTLAGEFKKVGDRSVYFITKSLLMEVSIVGIPCNGESSFQIVKCLPDDGDGIYAGELVDKKISEGDENESHSQHGDTMFKLMKKDFLSKEKVKALEAAGLSAELETEMEVSYAECKEAIVQAVLERLKEASEAKEAEEAAAAEAAAKEAEEAAAAEAAAKEAEEAAAAKAAGEESTKEDAESLKGLLENLKKLREVA